MADRRSWPTYRQSHSDSHSHSPSIDRGEETTSQTPPPAPLVPVKPTKRVRIKTERRREQCRLNQARYRDKQRSVAAALDENIHQLRRDVHQLELRRQTLRHAVNTRDSCIRVAMEYCRLFRYGLDVASPSPRTPGSRRTPALDQQVAFVTSTFHHNARVDDCYGRECLLEQSKRFAMCFDGLRIVPMGYTPAVSTCGASAAVAQATVQLQLTITPATIQHVYPHLLHPTNARIKRKLLGQRIHCDAALLLSFDEQGKVSAVEWTIDFMGALLAVLTIHETVIVLQPAQIVRDAYLLPVKPEDGVREQNSGHSGSGEPPMESLSDRDSECNYLVHDGQGDDYIML